MSVFANKLNQFLATAWNSPVEKTICNQLIHYKNQLLKDPTGAQQYINDFCNSNQDLLSQCSDDFVKAIKTLGEVITEAHEYHGVWEQTGAKIKDSFDRFITPGEVAAIKKLLLAKYNIKIKDKEKPTEEIILKAVPLKYFGSIEKDIKRLVNSELTLMPADLNGINHNIAPKVNKMEREKEMQDIMNSDNDEYSGFMECDTASMAVADQPIGLYKRKAALYDPYKNIANKVGKTETELEHSFSKLKEDLKSMNLENIDVVASNLNEKVDIAKVVVQEGKQQKTIEILKEMVIDYLVDHGRVEDYMDYNGNFDLPRYLKSRPKFMINQMFRECFKRILENSADNAIQVEDYEFGPRLVKFYWGFPSDMDARVNVYKKADFEAFLERTDPGFHDFDRQEKDEEDPYRNISYHDFEAYWDAMDWDEKKEYIRRFLLIKGANTKDGLHEASIAGKTNDYAEWRAAVATRTGNSYRIVPYGASLKTQAVDAQGQVVGEWDPDQLIGYIYK